MNHRTSAAPRSSPLAVLPALAAALFLAAPAPAQGLGGGADSASSAGITGFASLPWGATAEEVAARWGPPDTTHALEALSATALVYPDEEVLGESAAMGVLVHEEHGLIRGQYLVRYGGGRDCERVYRKYRDAVGQALTGLPRRERKTAVDEESEIGFCTAFELGDARAWSRWRDSASGAAATVRLDAGQGVLRVSYEGPGFDRLTKRARARVRKARFGGAPGAAGGGAVPDSAAAAGRDSAALDSLRRMLGDTSRGDSAGAATVDSAAATVDSTGGGV